MNVVILMGRLTKDPDMRGDGNGLVAKYTLAVDRKYSKDGEKQADFINCTCFSKGAEFAEKYLKKRNEGCNYRSFTDRIVHKQGRAEGKYN